MMSAANQVKWFFVAKTDDIPFRQGKRVYFESYEVALFNLGNSVYRAIDNRCPHKQGPLGDGLVAAEAVFCPLHNWKIDLQTGCALSGGQGQVKTYPVKLIDNKIYIAFEAGKFSDCQAGAVSNPEEAVDAN